MSKKAAIRIQVNTFLSYTLWTLSWLSRMGPSARVRLTHAAFQQPRVRMSHIQRDILSRYSFRTSVLRPTNNIAFQNPCDGSKNACLQTKHAQGQQATKQCKQQGFKTLQLDERVNRNSPKKQETPHKTAPENKKLTCKYDRMSNECGSPLLTVRITLIFPQRRANKKITGTRISFLLNSLARHVLSGLANVKWDCAMPSLDNRATCSCGGGTAMLCFINLSLPFWLCHTKK